MAEKPSVEISVAGLTLLSSFSCDLGVGEEVQIILHPYENRFCIRLEDIEAGEKPATRVFVRSPGELVLSLSKFGGVSMRGTLKPKKVGVLSLGSESFELWVSYLVMASNMGVRLDVTLYSKTVAAKEDAKGTVETDK